MFLQEPETSKDATNWPSLNSQGSKDTSPATNNLNNKPQVTKNEKPEIINTEGINGEASNESNQDVKENKNDSNVSSKKKKGN